MTWLYAVGCVSLCMLCVHVREDMRKKIGLDIFRSKKLAKKKEVSTCLDYLTCTTLFVN